MGGAGRASALASRTSEMEFPRWNFQEQWWPQGLELWAKKEIQGNLGSEYEPWVGASVRPLFPRSRVSGAWLPPASPPLVPSASTSMALTPVGAHLVLGNRG